ncbi:MAG: DUF3606 domain-containing protein [Betaproteobacteria bacterium]
MEWFLVALVVAAGGIWTFYVRSKRMRASDQAAATAAHASREAAVAPGTPHINVNDAADVARWTREFGVDEYDLKGAVQVAGPGADAVRRHLADK